MGKTKVQREQAMKKAHKLYLEGMSWDKIANKVDYSKSTVQKWKREHNWDGESLKKKSTKKSSSTNSQKSGDLSNKLIHNFVSLQKVMTNLSMKLDDLNSQISGLLDLFENSAKSLAEKEVKMKDDEGNEIKKKLGELFEQNKTIAKGLTLIHENNFQGQNPSQQGMQQGVSQMEQSKQQGFQNQQPPQNHQMTNPSQNPEYQQSTSTQNRFKQLPRS
ncbi:MAG: helix-turn-helix domain-containing protein [Nanoarchaeota archaeon]